MTHNQEILGSIPRVPTNLKKNNMIRIDGECFSCEYVRKLNKQQLKDFAGHLNRGQLITVSKICNSEFAYIIDTILMNN